MRGRMTHSFSHFCQKTSKSVTTASYIMLDIFCIECRILVILFIGIETKNHQYLQGYTKNELTDEHCYSFVVCVEKKNVNRISS